MTPDRDLECAEYVLGVLDGRERRNLEHAMEDDAELRASVSAWEARLAPLGESVPDLPPPARVWRRIQADLGHLDHDRETRDAPERGIWHSVRVWRAFALAVSVAMVCLVAIDFSGLTPTLPGARSAYVVATITGQSGQPHWTVTIDPSKRELVVVPGVGMQIADSASTELWLVPENASPISLGVFAPNRSTTIGLARDTVTKLTTGSALAVSLEPKGGSPTGQPTGPIVAKGGMQGT